MGDDTVQPRGGAWEPQEDREPEAARNRPLASQHLGVDALNDYLDGGLTAADRAVATAHLATCDDCRRELAELRATVALVRGLPQYAARRSFQLGLEYARSAARPGGWVARLLPALPAVRAATVAVAVLLVAVTAGDFVANREDSRQRAQQPITGPPGDQAFSMDDQAASNQGPTPAPALIPAPAAPPARDEEAAGGGGTESTAASSKTMEAGTGLSEPQAPQSAGQAAEAEQAAPADEVRDDAAADADVAESTGPGLAASPGPAVAAPTVSPAGRAAAAPTTAGGAGARTDGEAAPVERAGPSVLRLAQVALGLLLLWLIVGLVGLQRLQRRG